MLCGCDCFMLLKKYVSIKNNAIVVTRCIVIQITVFSKKCKTFPMLGRALDLSELTLSQVQAQTAFDLVPCLVETAFNY